MTDYQPYPAPEPAPRAPSAPRRLVRREDNKVVAGVCSGVADYLRVDANIVRLALVAAVVFGAGSGVLLYLAGWWLMPRG
ncbi:MULTISPECIES: PspC domain-containing protein [Nocardioides]|uniref:PspC domain-containing protein n=1 Tax=Nocardioides vastitatis TaxID=2568655 RepID=A0ABW0ZK21_9ACTN|nr:PspC domain-containing protein [Nocardioides sp.]THJ07392.1 PspC domain-containing protein [Nocardioides sp.]